jgi:hypothetical protein
VAVTSKYRLMKGYDPSSLACLRRRRSRVIWSFVYLALRRVLELMVLCWRSADAKEVEILWSYATSWQYCTASTHGRGSSPTTARCLRRLACDLTGGVVCAAQVACEW